ncbi:reverse transcriptase domain-containing protein [Tanacetum coccineum]
MRKPCILSTKLDDALWAFRTAFKTPIGCTPYQLVYEKSCHLPVELEHKSYWALKHVNFDLKTAGEDEEASRLKDQESNLQLELSQPDGPNFKANGHRVKHYFGGDIPPMEKGAVPLGKLKNLYDPYSELKYAMRKSHGHCWNKLVDRINVSIGQDATSKSLIVILDIYGFESFKNNSLFQKPGGIIALLDEACNGALGSVKEWKLKDCVAVHQLLVATLDDRTAALNFYTKFYNSLDSVPNHCSVVLARLEGCYRSIGE